MIEHACMLTPPTPTQKVCIVLALALPSWVTGEQTLPNVNKLVGLFAQCEQPALGIQECWKLSFSEMTIKAWQAAAAMYLIG